MKKFWMVWCHGGQYPKIKHETIEAARTEAARLARCDSSHEFIVLEAIEGFKIKIEEPPVESFICA